MRKSQYLVLAVGMGAIAGCDQGQTNVLGGTPAIAYLSRGPAGTGNVFDYRNGGGEDNLFTLTPPTASGVKKNLTNWVKASINSFDVSFDAREMVFSAQAPNDDHYQLYRIGVDGTNPCDALAGKVSIGPCQITDGPYDRVNPIYIPAGRIMFLTNQNVEGSEVPQMNDEYERAPGSQLGTCNTDGSGIVLGPRNVSHRSAPSLLADGRVVLTEWQHLGEKNEGILRIVNQDMTSTREAFGNEGKALTNSVLRAREVSPGKLVVIGTSRDRTFQAGKLLLVDLGGPTIDTQSEARSSAVDLTPDVPGDRTPSFKGVGRYFDVRPIGDVSKNQYLVSWSDGFVEDETSNMAKAPPDFGIYLFDANSRVLQPVVNEVGTWEVYGTPLIKRDEPTALTGQYVAEGTQGTLLSAVNVFDSTMFPNMVPGTVKRVRVTEGFSTEEGFPNMFGLSEFDGQARLGEFNLNADNSFKAVIPANVPVRIQLIDAFGMAIATDNSPGGSNASEPVWIQGRSGEARACNGCHEDRTETLKIAPGSSALQASDAVRIDYAGLTRQQRVSMDFSPDKVMGVPWDLAIQPILDRACVTCHDGTPGAANPSYTITDITDMTMFAHTFDLSNKAETINAGDMMYTYPASYISILGPSMAFTEKQIMVTGDLNVYVTPGNASASDIVKRLNPPQRYPNVDTTVRAFPGMPIHPSEISSYNGHAGTEAQFQLTPDEYYLIMLNADDGGQFYFRENKTTAY